MQTSDWLDRLRGFFPLGRVASMVLLAAAFALVAALFLMLPAPGSPEENGGDVALAQEAGGSEDVFFAQLEPTDGPVDVPLARFRAELFVDEAGCMRLGSSEEGWGYTVIWYPWFSLDADENRMRVFSEYEQGAVARVGKVARMGGGFYTFEEIRGLRFISRETKHELRVRCPGEYWLAGDSRIIRRR